MAFKVNYIEGSKNGLADFISRQFEDNLDHLISVANKASADQFKYDPKDFVFPACYATYFDYEKDVVRKAETVSTPPWSEQTSEVLSENSSVKKQLETKYEALLANADLTAVTDRSCDWCRLLFLTISCVQQKHCRKLGDTIRIGEKENACKCRRGICMECVHQFPFDEPKELEVKIETDDDGVGDIEETEEIEQDLEDIGPQRFAIDIFKTFDLEDFIKNQQEDPYLKHIIACLGGAEIKKLRIRKQDIRRLKCHQICS